MRRLLPLLALLPFTAGAAPPTTFPDLSTPPAGLPKDGAADVALIMAVEDYAALPDVPGARANALDWESYLRARGVGMVKLLTDNEVTPGKVLKVALPAVLSERGATGRVWVVFVGHGAPGPDDHGALVGWAAQQDPQSLMDDAISQTALLDAIGPGVPVTMVVDACFSGTSAAGELATGVMPVRPVEANVGTKATLMVAAKGDQYAGPLPGLGRPAFSWLVLGALRGWGDGDGNGSVTADEAVSWSRRQLAQVVNSRLQTPEVVGETSVAVGKGKEQAPDLVALVRAAGGDSGAQANVRGVSASASFSDLALDVSAKLREQRCAAEAQRAGTAARAKKLDAEAARLAAEATGAWAKLQPQATDCLELTDAITRESCARTVETFVSRASTLAATLPAGTEAATTECGSRTVAFAAESRAVSAAEVAPAKALAARLRGVPAADGDGATEAEWTSPTVGKMKRIPAGSFVMGSPPSEKARSPDEVQHFVTLTKGFLLMEHEVTQGEWLAVNGKNPSKFATCGESCPVEQVSWLDAVAFANAVSRKEGLVPAYAIDGDSVTVNGNATGYRLPTEAEWEYAARGDGETIYAGSDDLPSVAWVDANAASSSHPVCEKERNQHGLCDMTGNVWEWVWDAYAQYPTTSVRNPEGSGVSSLRVFRGGGWLVSPDSARNAFRGRYPPTNRDSSIGLRLARSLP